MKYPIYKREKKLSAKLSLANIKEIRLLRESGKSTISIARLFKISQSYVYYLCHSDDWINRKYKETWQRNKLVKPVITPEERKRHNMRKYKLQHRKLSKYSLYIQSLKKDRIKIRRHLKYLSDKNIDLLNEKENQVNKSK